MSEKTTTLYVTRHGETDWNTQGLIQGHTDIPLNENGRKQAGNIAKRLEDVQFDIALSSSLVRAVETAEIILEGRGISVETADDLKEGNLGALEGRRSSDNFPSLNQWRKLTELEQKQHESYHDFITVEEPDHVFERVTSYLREKAKEFKGKTILAVTHGGVLEFMLVKLGHIPTDRRTHIENGALAIIEYSDEGFKVLKTEGMWTEDA